MSGFGDARVEALAQAVARALATNSEIEVLDNGALVRRVAAALTASVGDDPDLDQRVRARIASLARPVPEGSREWDVLYRQYSDDLRHR